MKAIYSDQDTARIGYVQSVLEDAGILTFLRNKYSHNAMGLIKGQFPQVLCVADNADFEKAKAIIADLEPQPVADLPDWTCAGCNELVPGNFDLCWKCGAGREKPSR